MHRCTLVYTPHQRDEPNVEMECREALQGSGQGCNLGLRPQGAVQKQVAELSAVRSDQSMGIVDRELDASAEAIIKRVPIKMKTKKTPIKMKRKE